MSILKLNTLLTSVFLYLYVSSILLYVYAFIECFLHVKYCAGCTKMNSDSYASKTSSKIVHELEIVLDRNGHYLE